MKKTSRTKHVLIMAAGTGGHIIPALATAQALQKKGYRIDWLGTPQGLENQLVPIANIPLHTIVMHGIRGKGIKRQLLAPWHLLRAMGQSLRIMHRLKPGIVLGFGGFVSAPGGLAAWLLRIPLVVHEQNAVAGMSNRCLAYFARRVCQAFPHSFPARYAPLTCGNPVREAILTIAHPEQRLANRQGALRLLIVGGSQGARALNEQLPPLLMSLTLPVPLAIYHATGKSAHTQVSAFYQQAGNARVEPFIVDMAEAYAWADLVICRSGALTAAEIAAAGVASILIPYPHAVDDHQTKNAHYLVDAGAALLLPQHTLSSKTLLACLKPLLSDRTLLQTMAIKARHLALPQATQAMVAVCEQLLLI